MDGYNFKLNQIPCKNYDWVKSEDFEKINNLIANKISSDVLFEVRIEKSEVPELFDKRLIGFIDCIDFKNNIVWEFKFVDKVTQEHFLQLTLYAYLISNHVDYKHQNFKYFIYNIKKNQTFELKIENNNLIEIVRSIFYHKYGKKIKISDEKFLENTLKIMNKYKK